MPLLKAKSEGGHAANEEDELANEPMDQRTESVALSKKVSDFERNEDKQSSTHKQDFDTTSNASYVRKISHLV